MLSVSVIKKVERSVLHNVILFQEVNHCHYTGKVRGKLDSWAAISTCDGLSGVFYDGTELHYVEKDNAIDNTSDVSHFLYKHSDLAEHNKTCGFAGDAHPEHTHSTTDNRFLRVSNCCDYNRKQFTRGGNNTQSYAL